jgi:hypothetical protein
VREPHRLGFRRWFPVRYGRGVDDGVILEVLSDGGVEDGVRRDVGNSMVCTTTLIVSWKGVGAQLEVSGPTARSRHRPFLASYDKTGDSRLTRRFKGSRQTRWQKWRGPRGLVLRESLTGVCRGGRRLRVWDILVALGHTWAKQYVSDVRQITWSREGPSSGAGITLSHRNRRNLGGRRADFRRANTLIWRKNQEREERVKERERRGNMGRCLGVPLVI